MIKEFIYMASAKNNTIAQARPTYKNKSIAMLLLLAAFGLWSGMGLTCQASDYAFSEEAAQDNVSQQEASQGDILQQEASQGDILQQEALQEIVSQQEASQEVILQQEISPEDYFLIHGSGRNISCDEYDEMEEEAYSIYYSGSNSNVQGEGTDGSLLQENSQLQEQIQLQKDLEELEDIKELEELAISYAGTIPTRVMSDEGIEMLCGFEGLRLTAYKAVSTEQYYTIGYGHYGPDVTAGMTITKEQAVELLKSDVASRENYVNNFLKTNNLLYNQHQFDALVSFIYNIGTGNFSGSSIERLMKQGIENFAEDDIVYWISVWRKSGGQVLAGLEKRRAKESALFMRKDVELASLDLQGKVTFNFYLDMPACVENTSVKVVNGTSSATITNETKANDKGIAYAEISRIVGDTKVDTIKVTNIRNTKDADGKYKLSYTMILKDLADQVQLCLYDNTGKIVALYNASESDGCNFRYSLAKYREECKNLPTDTSNSANLKNVQLNVLLEELNTFVQTSRAFFGLSYDKAIVDAITGNETLGGGTDGGSKDETLMGATDEPTANEIFANTDSRYRKQITGEVDGLTYAGSSLLLDAGTSIRHYFKPRNGYAISDFTFTCNGKSIAPVTKGDNYYIAIENVAASDLDTFYELKVTNRKNTSQSMIISYAAMSYGCDAYRNNCEDTLRKVVDSMYLYNQAADLYFAR